MQAGGSRVYEVKMPPVAGPNTHYVSNWWPHLGTSKWITYGFRKPRRVSQVEVYWYDDRSHGCSLPEIRLDLAAQFPQ